MFQYFKILKINKLMFFYLIHMDFVFYYLKKSYFEDFKPYYGGHFYLIDFF